MKFDKTEKKHRMSPYTFIKKRKNLTKHVNDINDVNDTNEVTNINRVKINNYTSSSDSSYIETESDSYYKNNDSFSFEESTESTESTESEEAIEHDEINTKTESFIVNNNIYRPEGMFDEVCSQDTFIIIMMVFAYYIFIMYVLMFIIDKIQNFYMS